MKKKKKKSVLKKKEKIIIVIAGVLLFIITLGVALMPTRKQTKNQTTNSTDLNRDLTSIREVVEYLEATYISTENSKTSGYEIDIYVYFPYDLFEENISKESYFKNFYEKIAMVTNFKSFRIIDSQRDITIEVKCNNGKITEVKINGEIDYFKKELSRKSKENELQVETLNLEINSPELQNLINVNWITANANLGTAESKYDKYDIYFDEGYEIRTIQGKIYNIIFTNKYNGKVIEDYKPGDNLENIEAVLGTSYKGNSMIGYKTKEFYVIFTKDEISIYPNYQYDYTEFESLIEEYNEKKDINSFIDKLTDIWPDYDKYEYTNNSVELWYTLKGVKISYNNISPEGIQIYENYKGDLRIEKKDFKDTYYKLNENLMMKKEEIRIMQKESIGDFSGAEDDQNYYSKKFYLMASFDGNFYTKIRIISLDENYPNNELDEFIKIKSYVWANDTYLIYSIYNDGIYAYNAETRNTEKLIEGDQDFIIKKYDRNTNILEYDDQKVTVNF